MSGLRPGTEQRGQKKGRGLKPPAPAPPQRYLRPAEALPFCLSDHLNLDQGAVG